MAVVDCRIARALQSYTITYPSPDETLLGTPVALPTSEPADPQISYTVAAGHLPTVSPAGLQYILTAILYAAGKNTDMVASSQTVYYRILKNDTSIATGSANVSANYFYTWNHYNFINVKVGDVLACKLWATSTKVTWDYKALQIELTRPASGYALVADLSFNLALEPMPVLGEPGVGANKYYFYNPMNGEESYFTLTVGYQNVDLTRLHSVYAAGRIYRGDYYRTSTCSCDSLKRPYVGARNYVVTAISFRPLTIRV